MVYLVVLSDYDVYDIYFVSLDKNKAEKFLKEYNKKYGKTYGLSLHEYELDLDEYEILK